jgi:hypothetical protein
MKDDNNLEVLNKIINALGDLDTDTQVRTLQAVITFLNIPWSPRPQDSKLNESSTSPQNGMSFSDNRSMSPKDFLREKSPRQDSERIACLAYYLTHYRETPHFKTVDLSTLNTEAAQPKFSNAAVAVNNATRDGLLVQALKGKKQISAAGEVFVQTLPDRDAAKASLANFRLKKRNKKPSKISKTR